MGKYLLPNLIWVFIMKNLIVVLTLTLSGCISTGAMVHFVKPQVSEDGITSVDYIASKAMGDAMAVNGNVKQGMIESIGQVLATNSLCSNGYTINHFKFNKENGVGLSEYVLNVTCKSPSQRT